MASLVSSLAGAPSPAARRALDFFAAAMPRMTLAGGKGHTLLAECPDALLQFFGTPAACALRLVCREFQAAVAAYPWEDRETVIKGSFGGWSACFPQVTCALCLWWIRDSTIAKVFVCEKGHLV